MPDGLASAVRPAYGDRKTKGMVRVRVAKMGLALLTGVASAAMAQTVSPVPGFYDAADRTARPASDTVAEGIAVASAADPRAAAAGAEILKRGGSAADAAAATLIALTVVEPQSSGIGGGGFLIYHDAKTGTLTGLDGREKAPAAANPKHFFGPDGKPLPFREAVPGGKSVGVPGNVRLVAEMHKRWGRLPWAALFEPAIKLARDGFTSSERLNSFTAGRAADLKRSPAASATFLTPTGEALPEGTTVRMPELAWTLERIARLGPDGFYKGPVAKRISATVSGAAKNPSPLTEADLAAYKVAERPTICSPYRGYKVCSMSPPSSGGIGLAQMLGQLERFDMAKLGPDDVLAWHLFAESQKLAYADRAMWLADPGFAPVPTKGLIDPTYIASRSATIRIDRAAKGVAAGTPPGAPERPLARDSEVPSTSHFVAADAQGDVASLTSTIEGPFGSSLMAAGFMLNNELTDLDLNPVTADGRVSFNRVQPGKRPRSSMSPTIVYGPDGKVAFAIGAAGGATIIAQVAKAIIGVVDWKLPIADAIALPGMVAIGDNVRIEGGSKLEGMAAALKALGHNVSPGQLPLKANGLERTSNGWRGAADPRSEGDAVAAN